MMPELVLTHARVVAGNTVFEGTVVVRDGTITAVDTGPSQVAGAESLNGDFLLPGMVELHTDNLERHFEPRPGVLWPSAMAAVLAHDAQMITAGITTVLDAICVGEYREGGKRRYILAESVAAIKHARTIGLLRADHAVHLRCEVTDACVLEMFEPYADDPLVRLVSVMDHTPGQRQWRSLAKYREYFRGEGRSDSDVDAMLAEGESLQAEYAARHRLALVEQCRSRGLVMASHDDETEEHVREAAADGMTVSEFPTTLAAAAEARRHGMMVVMGAPNIVRGRSHSGNVSASALAGAGLLDALSSDYVPASLLHGAFLLHAGQALPLPAAIALVTANPATLLGLTDRGRIGVGLRADLIRVRLADGLPVVRAAWRGGRRML